MVSERFSPDDPREWLVRARSNLAFAKADAPGVLYEDLSFSAQQAAEKAIKGVLLARDIPFPYTHDLSRLVTLLADADGAVPPNLANAHLLTRYALATRYPGLLEVVTAEEYDQAVVIAESMVTWAETEIGFGQEHDP